MYIFTGYPSKTLNQVFFIHPLYIICEPINYTYVYYFLEEIAAEKTSVSTRLLLGESVSANTLQREFELDDVLDYVKTGVAAIIEDEVTQR